MKNKISSGVNCFVKKILVVFTICSFTYSLFLLSMVLFNKSVLRNSNFAIAELEKLELQGITDNFDEQEISYITKFELDCCKNIQGIKKYRDETISWIDYLLFKFASYLIISLILLIVFLMIKIKNKSDKICDKCQ